MTNYISIKQIADDLYDNPLLQDISFERIINYALRLMNIIGCPRIFVDRIVHINIKDYRAELPCDFLNIIQVKSEDGRCYKYTTDSFHMETVENNYLTYKIQNNYIYTSNREGTIIVAYKAFLLDQDGFPLIPDNSSFIEALEAYIKKKHYNILFDQGKIAPAVYQAAQQEYAWYVGQAQSDLIRPSLDQMQSITNMWNTLVLNPNHQLNGFKQLGNREILKHQ